MEKFANLNELILALVFWITSNTNYIDPKTLPEVEFVAQNELSKIACKKKCEILEKNIYSTQNLDELNYKFELVFLDPPFKDENKNISGIINNLLSSNILTEKTLFILHRNKKSRNFDHKKLNILREEFYGSSKIIFFKFNY